MKVKLEPCRHCGDGAFLPIPEVVLEAAGWEVGDNICVDVGLSGASLILWKEGVPEGTKIVLTSTTDKSRETQRIGEEPV